MTYTRVSDLSTWFSDLPEEDQEYLKEDAIEIYAELLETGSITLENLPSGQKFVLQLTITKET